MAAYDRWDFVLCVLDALKGGGELVIDGRQIFRVDVGRPEGRELAHECATAAEFLRKQRAGYRMAVDAELVNAVHVQTDKIERAIVALGDQILLSKRKGRKR
jgi:hypothetical protein